jgi:hypothetical protein
MKLSELIKHLQEIEQDFIKHEVDVIIVNNIEKSYSLRRWLLRRCFYNRY